MPVSFIQAVAIIGFGAFVISVITTLIRLATPNWQYEGGALVGGIAHATVAVCSMVIISDNLFNTLNVNFFIGLSIVEVILAVAFFIGYANDLKQKA